MTYYRELNLPTPLLPTALEQLTENKRNGINTTVTKYLYVDTNMSNINPELTEIFKSLGLIPNVIIMLGFTDGALNRVESNQLIHFDITRLNNAWVKHPFAINWELTDTEAEFRWWDVGNTPEIYPAVDDINVNDVLSVYARGAHFGHRMNHTIEPHYQIIDKYVLTCPQALAINTSIPHSVLRKINQQPRCGLSIRFPLDQIPTWERGLEIFKNYI